MLNRNLAKIENESEAVLIQGYKKSLAKNGLTIGRGVMIKVREKIEINENFEIPFEESVAADLDAARFRFLPLQQTENRLNVLC